MNTALLNPHRCSLALALLLAALVAPASQGLPPDAPSKGLARASAKVERIQKKVRACTNKKRIKHGTNKLAPSVPLTRAANLLASAMQRRGFFGHIDHEGRDVGERVAMFARKARYMPLGENIAASYGAKGVCKAWMASPGHRANMLGGKYNVIGVGFAEGGEYGTYYVQVFGRGPRK